MAAKSTVGKRGATGPPGPPGERGATGHVGATGEVGPRGATGARGKGPLGVLGTDADANRLIKALDTQVEGIYRELTRQMNRMTVVQSQLEEVRTAIRRLAGEHATKP